MSTAPALAAVGAAGVALAGHLFLGFTVPGVGLLQLGSWAYWLLLALGAVWMAAGLRLLPAVLDRRTLLLVVGAGLLARALLVPLPFLTSTDAYRYLWDGRVQAAGVNPYAEPPRAAVLNDLRDDAVFPLINRKAAVTIYPPVAQAVFRAAHEVGIRDPSSWKALLLVVEGVSLALLARLAARRRAVVLYAWNPVPIIAFGLAGHLDALVVLAVLGAVAAWRTGRWPLVGTALGLAAGIKLWPLLLLPAFARRRDGVWAWRPVIGSAALAVGVLAASYLPHLRGVGGGVLGFLTAGFWEEEGYDDGTRFQLLRLVGVTDPRLALLLAVAIAAVVGMLVLRSREDAAVRAAWLFGAAAVLTTPYGWYATPLVALAVAGGAGAVWAWFPLSLEAAYLTFFHNVWQPWLGDGLAQPIRRIGAGAVVAVLAAALVWPTARRLVRPTRRRVVDG